MGPSMSMEIWLDAIVAILLVVTVGYCLVLNRRLTALRGNQSEMQSLLMNFTEATRQAESSISHLKLVSDQVGATLEERVKAARELADELDTITQSGSRLADRIESGLVGRAGAAQPSAPSDEYKEASAKLSESERELAEILRQAR